MASGALAKSFQLCFHTKTFILMISKAIWEILQMCDGMMRKGKTATLTDWKVAGTIWLRLILRCNQCSRTEEYPMMKVSQWVSRRYSGSNCQLQAMGKNMMQYVAKVARKTVWAVIACLLLKRGGQVKKKSYIFVFAVHFSANKWLSRF